MQYSYDILIETFSYLIFSLRDLIENIQHFYGIPTKGSTLDVWNSENTDFVDGPWLNEQVILLLSLYHRHLFGNLSLKLSSLISDVFQFWQIPHVQSKTITFIVNSAKTLMLIWLKVT